MRRKSAQQRCEHYIKLLEGEVTRLGGDVEMIKHNTGSINNVKVDTFHRLSAVADSTESVTFAIDKPAEFTKSTEDKLEKEPESFYIGDEDVEAADAKEIRRNEAAAHWMELEKIEARFGHPPRRSRKWMRRNMVLEHDEEKEEDEDKSKKDVKAEAKKDDAKKTEAPKAAVAKKKKKIKKKKAARPPLYSIQDLD